MCLCHSWSLVCCTTFQILRAKMLQILMKEMDLCLVVWHFQGLGWERLVHMLLTVSSRDHCIWLYVAEGFSQSCNCVDKSENLESANCQIETRGHIWLDAGMFTDIAHPPLGHSYRDRHHLNVQRGAFCYSGGHSLVLERDFPRTLPVRFSHFIIIYPIKTHFFGRGKVRHFGKCRVC